MKNQTITPIHKSMHIPITMIIGPPRSGTSLLGRVLDRHPGIATWIEPYFIWDHHFREASHDQRDVNDVTDIVRSRIRGAFARYRQALDVDMIVDKSPRHCLKIPFVNQIFPEASYIFLLRDGRDNILSMKQQWEGKKEIFSNSGTADRWDKRLIVLKKWLAKRPGWNLRWQSFCFEIGPLHHWLNGKLLNQIRWEGRFGWGPRFRGWQELIDRTSLIEFTAHQWRACAQGILENISSIPEDRKIVLRYEDFIKNPETALKDIFAFLHLDFPGGFMDEIPKIWANNSNKWPDALSSKELQEVGPILGPTIIELGYEKDLSWFEAL